MSRLELVLDATPIIHAAKTPIHALFGKLDLELCTTSVVMRETLHGDFEGRLIIETFFQGQVRVEEPVRVLAAQRGLHAGESTAIALALEKNAVLMTDDRVARTVAKAMGVTVVYSTFFIFRALGKKAISKPEAERLVGRLIESGWWCDAETLARIYDAIRGF